MSQGAVSLSTLGRDDLDAVAAIDAESFVRPWTRAMYEAELANAEVTRLFGIAVDGSLVGYCAAWVLPGELHINNLAILPSWRRQGLARRLIAHVLDEADRLGCQRATLEVRRSNHAARQLYEHLGFTVHGVRRDYYAEPVEDALILWLDRAEAPTP